LHRHQQNLNTFRLHTKYHSKDGHIQLKDIPCLTHRQNDAQTAREIEDSHDGGNNSKARKPVQSFPNPEFPFGDDIHLTIADNEARKKKLHEHPQPYNPPINWFSRADQKKSRTLYKKNKLGQSELFLDKLKVPEAYWSGVLWIAPQRR
jgi:hypothetical protein